MKDNDYMDEISNDLENISENMELEYLCRYRKDKEVENEISASELRNKSNDNVKKDLSIKEIANHCLREIYEKLNIKTPNDLALLEYDGFDKYFFTDQEISTEDQLKVISIVLDNLTSNEYEVNLYMKNAIYPIYHLTILWNW